MNSEREIDSYNYHKQSNFVLFISLTLLVIVFIDFEKTSNSLAHEYLVAFDNQTLCSQYVECMTNAGGKINKYLAALMIEYLKIHRQQSSETRDGLCLHCMCLDDFAMWRKKFLSDSKASLILFRDMGVRMKISMTNKSQNCQLMF
ncbi:CLUMA_CG007523, isoform A [Clunio marinus]|uniref:CLUMA_CG007523, isoform A n=1 Tax=Clunio marinus TaxID=568069 RepID=A0A1J1I138_9DIPT|nr:CLUMA_CG007523, isoform A [Clunio marinus]